jgi:hypothetical protein
MKGFKIVKVGDYSLYHTKTKFFVVELDIPNEEWVQPKANDDLYGFGTTPNFLKKCRASKAKVVAITPAKLQFDEYGHIRKLTVDSVADSRSQVLNKPQHTGPKTLYRVGRWVYPDQWSDAIKNSGFACDHGIHFFKSLKEIIPYLNEYFV